MKSENIAYYTENTEQTRDEIREKIDADFRGILEFHKKYMPNLFLIEVNRPCVYGAVSPQKQDQYLPMDQFVQKCIERCEAYKAKSI